MYLHVYNNVTVYSLHPFLVTGDDRGELVYITDVQEALGFMKVLLSAYPDTVLAPHLKQIVSLALVPYPLK